MTKKLSGKVALVTGGSRGIGAASARALADEGADVAISYVASPDKAEAVVAELKARGVKARAFRADQASAKDVTQLVNDVAKEFGRLDILVNNAGVAAGGAIDDAKADTDALARQDQVNVHGVIAAIRAASQLMGEGGRIVTVGSMLADRASFPGLADYVATKAAVVGYTKGASAVPRKSPPAWSSSRARKPPSSPAPCSTSTAGSAPEQGASHSHKDYANDRTQTFRQARRRRSRLAQGQASFLLRWPL
jgi:NAD(P)-dependent dehydrogenase (short-subunit alcohol dehydrogenase family)